MLRNLYVMAAQGTVCACLAAIPLAANLPTPDAHASTHKGAHSVSRVVGAGDVRAMPHPLRFTRPRVPGFGRKHWTHIPAKCGCGDLGFSWRDPNGSGRVYYDGASFYNDTSAPVIVRGTIGPRRHTERAALVATLAQDPPPDTLPDILPIPERLPDGR